MRIKLIFALLVALLMFGCKSLPTADEIINGDEDEVVILQDEETDILLKNIDLSGVTALAIKPRVIEISMLDKVLQFVGIPFAYAAVECDELGTIDGGQYNELTVDGSTPCFSEVEFWDDGVIYAKYHLETPSETMQMMNVAGDIEMSILTDSEGNVHHLPGHPIKRNSFKNVKAVKSHNGNPVYINHENKLVRFDLATDTEAVMVDQAITNFSIKTKTDGDHFIVDAVEGVKRIKPDQSEDLLPELTPGNWHDIGGSVQYATGTKWMRMIIDPDGNITDRVGRSDPETFQAWIIDGVGIPMPTGVLFGGSVNGCTDEAVGDQRIMICNGKAFRVGADSDDLEEISTIDFGHPNINSFLTVKSCASNNYLYFYGESDSLGNRITWINNTTGEFRDILGTHQITDLECISDSELTVIGIDENLSITGADTISPVATVIDPGITNIITQ